MRTWRGSEGESPTCVLNHHPEAESPPLGMRESGGLCDSVFSPLVPVSAGPKREEIGRCVWKAGTLANVQRRRFLEETQSSVGCWKHTGLLKVGFSTRMCSVPRAGQLERWVGKGHCERADEERLHELSAQCVQSLKTERALVWPLSPGLHPRQRQGPGTCLRPTNRGPLLREPSALPQRARLPRLHCLMLRIRPQPAVSPDELLSPKNLELELELPTLHSSLDRGEANREARTDVRQVGGLRKLSHRGKESLYRETKRTVKKNL